MMVLISGILGVSAADATAQRSLTEAAVLMQRAEELHRAHRMEEALGVYEEVVLAEDDRGELPIVALKRIATIHLASGRRQRAADAMDRLAERAQWLGYPEAQADALLEAAVLHHQIGARSVALSRVRRLEPLLGSPYVSAEARSRIRARLRMPVTASR